MKRSLKTLVFTFQAVKLNHRVLYVIYFNQTALVLNETSVVFSYLTVTPSYIKHRFHCHYVLYNKNRNVLGKKKTYILVFLKIFIQKYQMRLIRGASVAVFWPIF